ncbi:EhaE family protein [Methanogenium sp. S4BF]|uniref:DUF2107 family protein n=1 Tax=Methanogenium sp. S4BF TaxID=1789226 RepID=UPI002417848D|nr:DUF2107 family protein [Methanogenium sp. S4BF]WFN35257.1 EhaE family protein [Methanogenium sp. S4BF]
MNPELILGCIILLAGVAAAAFPRERDYISRLIHVEIAGTGLMLIMLAYNETIALLTFVAVTAIATIVLVRVIERGEPSD